MKNGKKITYSQRHIISKQRPDLDMQNYLVCKHVNFKDANELHLISKNGNDKVLIKYV